MTYKVTGVLRNGKKFKPLHTIHKAYALGINLWKGNVWESTPTGWKKIKSVL